MSPSRQIAAISTIFSASSVIFSSTPVHLHSQFYTTRRVFLWNKKEACSRASPPAAGRLIIQFSSNPWRSLRSVFVSQEIASYETKNRRPVKTCGCISGSPVLSLLSLSIHANHILFFEYANIRHMSIIMPHIIAIFICMVVI